MCRLPHPVQGIAEAPLAWGGCMSDDASDWMYPKAVLISQDGVNFYDITQYVCDTDADVSANIGGIQVNMIEFDLHECSSRLSLRV